MNREAQAYAEKLAKLGDFEHALIAKVKEGENLYTDISKLPVKLEGLAKRAVTDWYSEIKDYDFTTTKCSDGRCFFRQLCIVCSSLAIESFQSVDTSLNWFGRIARNLVLELLK